MMKRWPSILMVLAGLLLTVLYFLPLWQITLIAPQYPTGVKLHIYINQIGGSEPGTLQNINILNHYVGMKKIIPESIPELTYLPWVVFGYIFLSFLVAILNKKWMYYAWLILLAIGMIAGLYDFYLWEYDYGHNLDPTAPMVFEGQAYQPPLIGSKVLLNFVAKSYPHYGGFAMIGSFLTGILALLLRLKQK
jgi:copper chaperone NosL